MSKPTHILGVYKITYRGELFQIKNLIEHRDYLDIIKPAQWRIYDLELRKQDKKVAEIKAELKNMFGSNWFTTESPLYNAMNSNILSLPDTQGGNHYCKLELI